MNSKKNSFMFLNNMAIRLDLSLFLYCITLGIGWFTGERFKLFSLTFMEYETDPYGFLILFDLQILKFGIQLASERVKK